METPDLSSMSPEEIREMQKQQCIFCHIVAGKVASKKIYEDDQVLAILDIHPANPGHLLLIPKEHYAIMPQMPDDLITHIAKVTKALSFATLKALKCEGTNVMTANGISAGQKAPHVIIHVIPRKPGDGVSFSLAQHAQGNDVIQKLGAAVSRALGVAPPVHQTPPPATAKKVETQEEQKSRVEPKTQEGVNPPAESPPEQTQSEQPEGGLDDIADLLLGK